MPAVTSTAGAGTFRLEWAEALRAVIAYSFGEQALMPVHRIEALVLPENRASLRVLEKLRFEQEGVRREFGFWKGRYRDVLLYALLNSNRKDL